MAESDAPGTERWSFEAGNETSLHPTVVDGTVYVGSRDHHIYALDASTGREEWSFETEDEVILSPTVVDGVLYVVDEGGNLYAVWTESSDLIEDKVDSDTGVVYSDSSTVQCPKCGTENDPDNTFCKDADCGQKLS